MVDREIVDYIEENILPVYDSFDRGHGRDHVLKVIDTCIEMGRELGLDLNMVYIIAAYHDIGLLESRENHHIASGAYLLADEYIGARFSEDEITIMKEAIEDHRASIAYEPRSIYGKVISDGDRDLDLESMIERSILFGLKKYRKLTREEHVERVRLHLKDKYGYGGYVRLWLDIERNNLRLEAIRETIEDEEALNEKLYKIYDRLVGKE